MKRIKFPFFRENSTIEDDNHVDVIPEEINDSLIARQWRTVVPLALFSYLSIQIILSYTEVCRIYHPYADWTRSVAIAVLTCFVLNITNHIANAMFFNVSWSLKVSNHLVGVAAGAVTVSAIAGTSTALFLTQQSGDYVCNDGLGVESPNSQYAEWLVAAPLLTYITIAVEDKPALTWEDLNVISSIFWCILFAFLMNTTVDFVANVALFILSSICMSANLFVICMGQWRAEKKVSTVPSTPVGQLDGQSLEQQPQGNDVIPMTTNIPGEGIESSKRRWIQERSQTKTRLAWLLSITFPLFPILYLLHYWHVIDRDQLAVGYMLGGILTKFAFIALLSFESVLMGAMNERQMTERRRQFLRYVFHEVRVPLNTLTMGICLLSADADALKETQRDVVRYQYTINTPYDTHLNIPHHTPHIL